MAKIDTTVGQLVDMIERGELRLPEMQRRYVWTSTRVRDLLDSLYRGYPSGTILVWETDAEQPVRDLQVQQEDSPFERYKLLLDGQQRLTSLSAVIRGEPINVRNRKRPIDIAFNLDHPDGPPIEIDEIDDDSSPPENENNDVPDDEVEESEMRKTSVLDRLNKRVFSVSSKQLLSRPNWISVSEIFKGEKSDWAVVKDLVDSPDDPKFALYTDRLQRIRKMREYPYVMQVLDRSLSYEEVAEIFVRVNSLGAKLRGSDLAIAQITAKWPNSLKIFEEFLLECEDNLFPIDIGLIIRLMVVFATKQSRFKTVASIPLKRLQAAWEKAIEGMRFAINYLRTNAGIENATLLSSPMFTIPIAVYGMLKDQNISPQDEKEMLRWLYVAHAKAHYSGSSESTLDRDLGLLFKGGKFSKLIDVLVENYGRLHVEESELRGRGIRSPLFSLAYLALKYSGAKDWKTGLGLSLTHQGNLHYIEYHHIFPRSILRKEGFEKSEINAIANMAFISGRANRKISNKYPKDYLPVVIEDRGEDALTAQGIPVDTALWEIDRYRDFLNVRRKNILKAINVFINNACEKGKAAEFKVE